MFVGRICTMRSGGAVHWAVGCHRLLSGWPPHRKCMNIRFETVPPRLHRDRHHFCTHDRGRTDSGVHQTKQKALFPACELASN